MIAFHEIKDGVRFREKMEWLKAEYEVVSVPELTTRPLGSRTMVALTFDDGYGSWHEVAAPILRDLALPATFFVCSGFVGLDREGAAAFCRRHLRRTQRLRPLSRRELDDLASDPLFEIGSHTRHHVDLGQVWESSILSDEIDGDRQCLEDWTGRPVSLFAYPFGRPRNVSLAAIDRVAGAGFRVAFTFVPGFLDQRSDVLRVQRDGLDERDSAGLWKAWLGGGYDRPYALKEGLWSQA